MVINLIHSEKVELLKTKHRLCQVPSHKNGLVPSGLIDKREQHTHVRYCSIEERGRKIKPDQVDIPAMRNAV